MSKLGRISRHILLPGLLALPLILLVSSVLTFREFNEMKGLYLRNRAATIAARLETLSLDQLSGNVAGLLVPEEPALVDVVVLEKGENGPEQLIIDSLLAGRQLFRTFETAVNGEKLLRAYIPFHSDSRLLIARIDLDASGADFLLVHARHNLLVALFSGLALVMLSYYVVWSLRRAAVLERRQIELEHLARLGELSAVLAHEIRNPLGAIKGFVQLAREKAAATVAGLLDPVLEEIRRLESLVNQLLLYGRPQEPELRRVDWDDIAGQLELHAAELIGARPIRFVRSPGNWRFRTDPDLLRQALLNLIRNSVEALAETPGGEVRLAAVRSEWGRFVISVDDNGPGIPSGVRDRIFEPFVTTKSFGAGLGLSITRKLATSLGGKLELRNLQPAGTRAEIVFSDVEPEEGSVEGASAWKVSS